MKGSVVPKCSTLPTGKCRNQTARQVGVRAKTHLLEEASAAQAVVDTIEPETVDEYMRKFSGTERVLGALGVYRAAFTTMEQTEPLKEDKVRVPVVALGGEEAQGESVGRMVEMVAENVEGGMVPDCGHFIPEERPDEIVRELLAMTARADRR